MAIEYFTIDMVKELRSKLGWNQAELAEYIGCGVRAICLWETGKVRKMRRVFRMKFIELRKEAKL